MGWAGLDVAAAASFTLRRVMSPSDLEETSDRRSTPSSRARTLAAGEAGTRTSGFWRASPAGRDAVLACFAAPDVPFPSTPFDMASLEWHRWNISSSWSVSTAIGDIALAISPSLTRIARRYPDR